jgi:hypothetical protein
MFACPDAGSDSGYFTGFVQQFKRTRVPVRSCLAALLAAPKAADFRGRAIEADRTELDLDAGPNGWDWLDVVGSFSGSLQTE